MKRMLFIIPWSTYYVGKKDLSFLDNPERPPEGVVVLASYLIKQGADIKIADLMRELRRNNGDVVRTLDWLWELCSDFNPDVIGFSFFTARFENVKDIYDDLKARYDNCFNQNPLFIAGGVHPTLMPQITLQYIPFDYLIIGEGEISLTKLLKGENLIDIPGIYKNDDNIITYSEILDNLDQLPFPDWSLIDFDFYTQSSHQLSSVAVHKVMPLTFGRSCVYRCNFCAHNCFLKARFHSAEYFIRKMEYVARQCDIKTFIIQDSSIGNFRKSWVEVCKRLIKMGSPYQWWANLRVNQVDELFLNLLKKAGCIKLFFGFESGSQRMLDHMNKKITVEQCRNAARLCHKLNIPFYSSYIVNYFGETEEDLEKTEQLIIETKPDSLAINKFSPIPGSIDYEKCKGSILPLINDIHDWTNLGMLIAPKLFGNMTEERFEYWFSHLKQLKEYINTHESFTQE